MTSDDFKPLAQLLRRRVEVIADHGLRDRNPAAHLEELKAISEAITVEHGRLRSRLPARLNHFLSQASYAKALAWLEEASQLK